MKIPFLCLALLCSSGGRPVGDPADVLRDADRAFCQATRERGLEGWLSWFASDAVVFPPSGPLAVGSAEVRRHYASQNGFPPKGFVWEPESAEISAAGNFGWTSGRWGNDASGTASWAGKYLSVWRKEADGAWKAVADCALDPGYAGRLPGLSGPPQTLGRESEHAFHSAAGDMAATMGSWWANDADGNEAGGKFLSLWRKQADGTHELVTETGILQVIR